MGNMQTPVSASLYDREYYQKYNPGYSSFIKGGYIIPDLKKELDQIDLADKKVLDIGCGRGEFIYYALQRGAREVSGVDYSEASVEITRKLLTQYLSSEDLNHVDIFQMDAKDLEFEDSTFDVIVMLDIIEHLHDWELKKCLMGVKRVLKTGGMLIVHTSPNHLMMQPVRAVAKVFNVTLKSSEFHVNEQSYFSMRKNFLSDFSGFIRLKKDRNYWRNQMDARGALLKKASKMLDILVDFPLVHLLMTIFPLSVLFCTSIWFKGTKKDIANKT
jgi:SAM-dependent methyltransferase